MTELKRSLDRALSGVEFRPELRRRVLQSAAAAEGQAVARHRLPAAAGRGSPATGRGFTPDAGREPPAVRRRISAALVFALIAALILMGVAVAAVITRGFGWYATQTDDPAWQYNLNELDKRATVVAAERTAPNSGASGPRFEVTQAYYDGSRIDVAYTLRASDRYADASWRPKADELETMEFYPQDNEPAFDDPDANRQLLQDLREQGVCGLHIHSYRVGENLKVAGVPCPGWDSYDLEWTDGMTSRYQVLDELPKEARDRDSVEMTFDLTEYDLYYYQTQQGYYSRLVNQESVPLAPVVVPRGKGRTMTVVGSKSYESYRVYAKVSVSPVEIEALICQVLPDEWVVKEPFDRAEELKGVDYIKDYRLIADGAALETFLSAEGNGAGRLENELPKAFREAGPKKLYTLEIEAQGVPEGTKELRLRPVYAISGERPSEDLVLEIPDAP